MSFVNFHLIKFGCKVNLVKVTQKMLSWRKEKLNLRKIRQQPDLTALNRFYTIFRIDISAN